MQRRITYLGLLVGAWLTLGCDEKQKDGDANIATPDPSAVGRLLATASAVPATSGGSAPAASTPSGAPEVAAVAYDELSKREPGPGIVSFVGRVIDRSKCEASKDGKPCLKYIIVSSQPDHAYDKSSDFAVLTPGDPEQYPLGKMFDFSVTVTSKKEVGGKLYDLRLVYARPFVLER